MMKEWRTTPPRVIAGSSVSMIKDYLSGESCDLTTGKVTPIDTEKSNVLQFITADKTIVSVRPSGTEPKIKYYFGLRVPHEAIDKSDEINPELYNTIKRTMKDTKQH